VEERYSRIMKLLLSEFGNVCRMKIEQVQSVSFNRYLQLTKDWALADVRQ